MRRDVLTVRHLPPERDDKGEEEGARGASGGMSINHRIECLFVCWKSAPFAPSHGLELAGQPLDASSLPSQAWNDAQRCRGSAAETSARPASIDQFVVTPDALGSGGITGSCTSTKSPASVAASAACSKAVTFTGTRRRCMPMLKTSLIQTSLSAPLSSQLRIYKLELEICRTHFSMYSLLNVGGSALDL